MKDVNVVKILCEIDYITLKLITKYSNDFSVSIHSNYIELFNLDSKRSYIIRKFPEFMEAVRDYKNVSIKVRKIVSEKSFAIIPQYLLEIKRI